MKQLKVNTLHELQELIATYGEAVLFRGQLEHYGEPSHPSVIASFDRRVCVPSEAVKWMSYASKVLEVLIGDHVKDISYVQALLQHYGWRSFYIDCTSSPAVSAWFASHKYTESLGIDMCEDCGENFLWERKKFAQYNFEEGDGHLYIIDKSIAKEVGLVDLSTLTLSGTYLRTDAQKAWLLGPTLGEPIPKECFVAHITASRSIFRDYANLHDLTNTDSVFPPASKDPILKALLELPWREIKSLHDPEVSVPVFQRALELPEYHNSFEKIASPTTAFYRGQTISEMFDSLESRYGLLTGGEILSASELILFGSADTNTPLNFPKIEKKLEGNNYLAFEIDEIVKHPNVGDNIIYQKGIGIISHSLELFEVCALVVMHPGIEMTNAGFSPGWFYRRKSSGLWEREYHEYECDCGNENIHNRNISALHIAEDLLTL
ncbi:FRG domain-containing protein [Vibrio parahaemolyticus]|nr:FRG domain-containing protein [Vibrio parahaemolyticus]